MQGKNESFFKLHLFTKSLPDHYRINKYIFTSFGDHANLLFIIFIIIYLIPIWAFKYFPSQDGPSHIENVYIAKEYLSKNGTIFREYFTINKGLLTNIFTHYLMVALMYFASPITSEKILLSVYIILFPSAFLYVLSAISQNSKFLAILSFPFIYSLPFQMGFYNFSYSLVGLIFTIGFWLRYHNSFQPSKLIGMFLLLSFTCICHIMSFLMVCVAIMLMEVWFLYFDLLHQHALKQLNFQTILHFLKLRIILPLVVIFPILLFVKKLVFGHVNTINLNFSSYWSRFKLLASFNSLRSFNFFMDKWLLGFFICLMAGIFFYVVVKKIRIRIINKYEGFLVVSALYMIAYFIAPGDTPKGGGWIIERLGIYPFLFLIFWFGATFYNTSLKKVIILTTLGISLLLPVVYCIKYYEINCFLREYLSGMNLITPNSTILPFNFFDNKKLSKRIDPFLHASGYIVIERNVVELNNYEAMDIYGNFPVNFKKNLNPSLYSKNLEDLTPNNFDFQLWTKETGKTIDYMVIGRSQKQLPKIEPIKRLYEKLSKNYELIYISKPNGIVEIYHYMNK